ncbi:alpha/beta fold hydrolase [Nocardia jejuensis]|uniref:alpha/beta fold hydrolase n=1 Tax=Nocardia jejuensis TaxID=328049 RepID=UPI000A8E66C8|nr:alpha/beta hydrolase [Nocardia jejuensis]
MVEDTAHTANAPRGTLHELADGALLLHRSGIGGPPVVFLAGGGMSGLYYWKVHELVAGFTTSVLYDRRGLGWSSSAELPRSGIQVTDDLRELLRVANVPGPYVLVGHSLGGLYARLYAKRFPGDVVGMVLLDPTHEQIVDYLSEEKARLLSNPSTADPLPPDRLDAMRATYRAAFGQALAEWPADLREPLLDQGFSHNGFRQSLREPMNLPRLFDEVRAAGPDPDVPLTVIAAMGTDTIAEELTPPEAHASLAESTHTKNRLYTDLTTALPQAEIRHLHDVGHSTIAWLRPDAIAETIRDMIGH